MRFASIVTAGKWYVWLHSRCGGGARARVRRGVIFDRMDGVGATRAAGKIRLRKPVLAIRDVAVGRGGRLRPGADGFHKLRQTINDNCRRKLEPLKCRSLATAFAAAVELTEAFRGRESASNLAGEKAIASNLHSNAARADPPVARIGSAVRTASCLLQFLGKGQAGR